MSEKRFTYFKVPLGFGKQAIKDNANDEVFDFTLSNVLDKLNEQQATINELKERNLYNFAKKMQLQKEIKELKEEEKLYANEIVRLNKNIEELNKTLEEVLKFKELGGDY